MRDPISRMFDLSGKVTLIIGGAVNFGYDMADILASAGSDLIITSRDIKRAESSSRTLRDKHNIDVLPLELDITEGKQVATLVTSAQSWKGHIDVLVNNAGGGSGKGSCHLFERSFEEIDRLIKVNLNGPLYCCREVGRVMAKQKAGKIINIASIAGLIGRDRRMYERNGMSGQPVDYAAAKAGLIGMTRDLAAMLAPMGIQVNAISPGGFNRKLPDGFVKDYADRTPLGHMGRDGIDLQGAVLYLASSASDYVTGHNLVVDGGFTAWQ